MHNDAARRGASPVSRAAGRRGHAVAQQRRATAVLVRARLSLCRSVALAVASSRANETRRLNVYHTLLLHAHIVPTTPSDDDSAQSARQRSLSKVARWSLMKTGWRQRSALAAAASERAARSGVPCRRPALLFARHRARRVARSGRPGAPLLARDRRRGAQMAAPAHVILALGGWSAAGARANSLAR